MKIILNDEDRELIKARVDKVREAHIAFETAAGMIDEANSRLFELLREMFPDMEIERCSHPPKSDWFIVTKERSLID